MLVTTKLGPVELERLRVHDKVTWEGSARVTATEWFLEGELVRRDVWANMLTGLVTQSKTGNGHG